MVGRSRFNAVNTRQGLGCFDCEFRGASVLRPMIDLMNAEHATQSGGPGDDARSRMHSRDRSRVDPAELAKVRERIRYLTQMLDEAFEVPGTSFRFGWDPILGLVPGIGDVISMLPSIYILWEAKRLGISRRTRGRMLINVILDTVIGSVPVIGQAADFVWKANVQNAKMMGIDLDDKPRGK